MFLLDELIVLSVWVGEAGDAGMVFFSFVSSQPVVFLRFTEVSFIT